MDSFGRESATPAFFKRSKNIWIRKSRTVHPAVRDWLGLLMIVVGTHFTVLLIVV